MAQLAAGLKPRPQGCLPMEELRLSRFVKSEGASAHLETGSGRGRHGRQAEAQRVKKKSSRLRLYASSA